MSINKTLVLRRLTLIQDQHRELVDMAAMPLPEFLKPRNTAAAESFLRRALEAVFDVGRHLLAKSGHADLAQEYKSIARGLGDLGVVSGDLAARLVAMAGYRNRLVHLYYDVTPEELHRILQDELDALLDFVRQVSAHLAEVG